MASPDVRALPLVPRSLKNRLAIIHRRALLDLPHVRPLTAMVKELRAELRGHVPDFDPLDGGVEAQLLFLFEKPGPMTDPERSGKAGSGFVSRDNDDATAANIFHFMSTAGIARDQTLLWNAIPWWNGTITASNQEWKDGLSRLRSMIALLPNLRSVVLAGKKAAGARGFLEAGGMKVWESAHPSPRNRALIPERWKEIPENWARAAHWHP